MDVLEPLNRYKCKLQFNRLKSDILVGKIPQPFKVTIELTMRCNLNCRMCFRDRVKKSEELSLKDIKTILSHLPSSVNEIHLIGGEVFLREDIFDILDYLNKRDYKIRIHTNGTLIDEDKIKKLSTYQNLMGIGFSIDGTRELHNRIRGSDQAYDKTIHAIEMTKKILPVSINTVLLDENFKEIEKVFNILKDLGISEYRIEPEMFCTPEEVKGTPVESITANIKERGEYSYNAKDLKDLKKNLDRLAKDTGIKIVIAPRVAEIDSEDFIRGSIRENKNLFCKHLLVPRIDSAGNLIHCHIIKKSFGNLKESHLEDLWSSKETETFRKHLLENNLFPVCKRCCRLRSI